MNVADREIQVLRHRETTRQIAPDKPRLVAAIALANKMARSIWAMLVKEQDYRNPAAAAA